MVERLAPEHLQLVGDAAEAPGDRGWSGPGRSSSAPHAGGVRRLRGRPQPRPADRRQRPLRLGPRGGGLRPPQPRGAAARRRPPRASRPTRPCSPRPRVSPATPPPRAGGCGEGPGAAGGGPARSVRRRAPRPPRSYRLDQVPVALRQARPERGALGPAAPGQARGGAAAAGPRLGELPGLPLRRRCAGRWARGHDWPAAGVLVGNGSNELLGVALEAVAGPGAEVLGADPSFGMYPLFVARSGGTLPAAAAAGGPAAAAAPSCARPWSGSRAARCCCARRTTPPATP